MNRAVLVFSEFHVIPHNCRYLRLVSDSRRTTLRIEGPPQSNEKAVRPWIERRLSLGC